MSGFDADVHMSQLVMMIAMFFIGPALFKEDNSYLFSIFKFWLFIFPMFFSIIGIFFFFTGPIYAVVGLFDSEYRWLSYLYGYMLIMVLIHCSLNPQQREKLSSL